MISVVNPEKCHQDLENLMEWCLTNNINTEQGVSNITLPQNTVRYLYRILGGKNNI